MLQINCLQHESNSSYVAAKYRRHEISATLRGDDHCECKEFDASVTANAPVLALCRQLLAQGVDPDWAVAVYRCGILTLKVHSIREAAQLTVKTAGNGAPILALDGAYEGAAASPARSEPGSYPGEGRRP
jgi:hypothetical protein